MAKGKKNAELSLEERLEGALIPDWEQPHKIPHNWCWTNVKTLCDLINGRAFKPSDWSESGLPIVRIQNLNNPDADFNYFSGEVSPSHLLKGNELLFAWSGTPGTSFGAHIWWGNKAVLNQHIFKILFDEQLINKKFLKYAINQQLEWLISSAHGGAGLQHVTKGIFESTPIPLPPLAEQIRIADRIEHLFSKLDEAKEKAQAVVDGFEDRKAAILHKAFMGKLTAEWRKRNGRSDEDWVDTPLDEVCWSIFDGDHMPPPKSETGIPFLVISNVNTGHLSFENTRFVPQKYYDGLATTRKPEPGDVLYTLVGTYGIPVVVDDSRPFCFQRHMALLKPSNVDTYFLWYQLQSQEFYNKASAIATGTAQLTVPIKGLRKLSIKMPSDLEQSEVVRLLNELLMKEQTAKELAEQTIDRIKIMMKSILSRAFRGELRTNDPNDESAAELLKRIL